jgi:hypothetical protein
MSYFKLESYLETKEIKEDKKDKKEKENTIQSKRPSLLPCKIACYRELCSKHHSVQLQPIKKNKKLNFFFVKN